MTRGSFIPPEVRLIVLRMKAAGVPTRRICNWTGVSERSVQRIVQTFQTTGGWGEVTKKPHVGKLNAAAVEVCFQIGRAHV